MLYTGGVLYHVVVVVDHYFAVVGVAVDDVSVLVLVLLMLFRVVAVTVDVFYVAV